jgi:ribosomal protein S18 acetylase RimI-like enzyme
VKETQNRRRQAVPNGVHPALRSGYAAPQANGLHHHPHPAPQPVEPAPRIIPARVLIRPARPDDLEQATLLERRVGGTLAATLNELQRRLFALPEAFLLAELQRVGLPPQIVGMANGLIWTRDYPRSFTEFEKVLPSSSHNPRGDVLYVASLGVDPMWRGRGIALSILRETAEVARRRHLKCLRLIGHARTETLLARAGFRSVRPLTGAFRQHRHLMPQPVLMEMPLTPP